MRWEYRRIDLPIEDVAKDEFVKLLDEAGAEGWELVTALQHERHGYSREVHLVLKRPAAS